MKKKRVNWKTWSKAEKVFYVDRDVGREEKEIKNKKKTE